MLDLSFFSSSEKLPLPTPSSGAFGIGT